jgi:hypothetical protein
MDSFCGDGMMRADFGGEQRLQNDHSVVVMPEVARYAAKHVFTWFCSVSCWIVSQPLARLPCGCVQAHFGSSLQMLFSNL